MRVSIVWSTQRCRNFLRLGATSRVFHRLENSSLQLRAYGTPEVSWSSIRIDSSVHSFVAAVVHDRYTEAISIFISTMAMLQAILVAGARVFSEYEHLLVSKTHSTTGAEWPEMRFHIPQLCLILGQPPLWVKAIRLREDI